MLEIYKPIIELGGKYECSNLGNVRRVNKDYRVQPYRYLKKQTNKDGYVYVHCTRNYRRLVHRIVAELFLPNPNKLPFVNHKDLDKKNNCIENLEWVSARSNTNHANKLGVIGNLKITTLDTETGIFYDSLSDLSIAMNKSKKYFNSLHKKNKIPNRFIIFPKEWKSNYEKTC